MSQLTVFIGGGIGSDPYSPKTLSGGFVLLLRAMSAVGILDHAVGVKVPRLQNAFLMAKNFNRNRKVWRSQFRLDPVYRRALTYPAT